MANLREMTTDNIRFLDTCLGELREKIYKEDCERHNEYTGITTDELEKIYMSPEWEKRKNRMMEIIIKEWINGMD